MSKEYDKAVNGINELYGEVVRLKVKLVETEKLRDAFYNDRTKAEKIQAIYGDKLSIAIAKLEEITEQKLFMHISAGDMAMKCREIANEALTKIRTTSKEQHEN